MIEVRDCYKNVKLHKKNIGLFPYYIHNHPLKDVHDEVEIVYADIYTDDGERYHYEKCQLGDMIEADKHCIYVKGDTCEGRPILDIVVRTKYYYDFEVPDSTENIPQNEAQIGLKLNEIPNCVSLAESLENNDLNGILSVYEGANLGWIETPYIAPTATISVDNSEGTYSYSWADENEWGVSTGPIQPSYTIWSDADIAELRQIIEEHRNNNG